MDKRLSNSVSMQTLPVFQGERRTLDSTFFSVALLLPSLSCLYSVGGNASHKTSTNQGFKSARTTRLLFFLKLTPNEIVKFFF